MNKSILYLTDNSLDAKIAEFCMNDLNTKCINSNLVLISVSQKPINFGKNVCIGEIGRSWMSLYKQILAGIDACETDYIGIAEHDCLSGEEHLNWVPPKDNIFYYNQNCWLIQWNENSEHNGMYSYWPDRYAYSQLVCHKELLREAVLDNISLLDKGIRTDKGLKFRSEPGLQYRMYGEYIKRAKMNPKLLGEYHKVITKYQSEVFKTKQPNLDIRHGTNFTGNKNGKNRCYELPYWGKFEEVLKAS